MKEKVFSLTGDDFTVKTAEGSALQATILS